MQRAHVDRERTWRVSEKLTFRRIRRGLLLSVHLPFSSFFPLSPSTSPLLPLDPRVDAEGGEAEVSGVVDGDCDVFIGNH